MHRFFRLDLSGFCGRSPLITIVFLWVSGLLLGFLVAQPNQISSAIPARLIIESELHFWPLLGALSVSLFMTWLSVFFDQTWLLHLTVFMKALQLSFVWSVFSVTFNASAWLIRSLIMFGDFLALPLFWILWLRICSESKLTIFRNSFFVGTAVVLICLYECFFLAPFLAGLIVI